MRTIDVSTEVFARIWALRADGEESEDVILSRVLQRGSSQAAPVASLTPGPNAMPATPKAFYDRGPRTWTQPTWATDLAEVLIGLGGRARLPQIYEAVEKLRRKEGRSVPPQLGATVRRTLENHSSDSHNYRGGADLFCMPEGKGAGVWALR